MSEEWINGYQLLEPLKNDRSGFGRWSYARKDGAEVFIKEFLSPVYPIDPSIFSPGQLQKKKAACEDFVRRKSRFYRALRQCRSGSIVAIIDFFRYKSKYYIVTDRVNNIPMPPEQVAAMPLRLRILLMKVISNGIRDLHIHRIVHGDIRPDNILLKRMQTGMFTAKIIDFDSSFFEFEDVSPDDLQGDLVYTAPETARYLNGEKVKIGTGADIFALGVLYYQYFTGVRPVFIQSEDAYPFESVLSGKTLMFPEGMPQNIRWLLAGMLQADPAGRISIGEVIRCLIGIDNVMMQAEKR